MVSLGCFSAVSPAEGRSVYSRDEHALTGCDAGRRGEEKGVLLFLFITGSISQPVGGADP